MSQEAKDEPVGDASSKSPVKASGADGTATNPEPRTTKIQGYRIVQEVQGAPGRPNEKFTRQQVSLAADRLLAFDEYSNHFLLMRLDQTPVGFYQITKDQTEYTRGQGYEQVQIERNLMEKNLRENKQLKPADRAQALKENFVNEDGSRNVTLEFSASDAKRVGEIDFSVRRLIVKENGRTIIDALIADRLGSDGPAFDLPLFQFYRKLGAFSDQVLEKLESVKGIPLEVDFLVATASVGNRMKARVLSVVPYTFESTLFELDPLAKEVKESPFASCAVCKVQIEKKGSRRYVLQGVTHYFCGKDHHREWVEKHRPKRPPRRGGKNGNR